MRFPGRLTKTLLAVLAVFLAAGCLEGVVRVTSSYQHSPAYKLKPGVGFLYDPASSPGRVNSMMFLDRERDPAKTGAARVLLLGDSFVSGTTLAAHLERELSKTLGKPVEVIPMGFPGIGLGGMLAFYETYGRAFAPEAVVAVFNSSTFANDAPLLSAIKLRQSPDRPCSPFVEARPDGTCGRLEADSTCLQDALADLEVHVRPTLGLRLDEVLDRFLGWSYVYGWVKEWVGRDDPKGYAAFDHQFAYRLAQLRSRPDDARALEGWRFPDDVDMNMMFWTPQDTMPPVFRQAVANTACLLESLSETAKRGRALFLLAVTEDCTRPTPGMLREFERRNQSGKRLFVEAGALKKVLGLASSKNIQVVDLAPYFEGQSETAHPNNDIHLTEAGDRLAAKGISEALVGLKFGH